MAGVAVTHTEGPCGAHHDDGAPCRFCATPRKPGEPWDAYAKRVGGCPPVDLQPGEGVPLALDGWLWRERLQREARQRRAIRALAEAFVLCMADAGETQP